MVNRGSTSISCSLGHINLILLEVETVWEIPTWIAFYLNVPGNDCTCLIFPATDIFVLVCAWLSRGFVTETLANFKKGWGCPPWKLMSIIWFLYLCALTLLDEKWFICSWNGNKIVFENLQVKHMRLIWSKVTHFVMDSTMTNSIYNRKMKDGEDF